MDLRVLVVNAGSTSLKLSVVGDDDVSEPVASLAAAPAGVDAVGHRVVHGGARFREPVLIDDAVERELAAVSDLAPLHNDTGVVHASERSIVRLGREHGARAQERLQGASGIALRPAFELAELHGVEPKRRWSGRRRPGRRRRGRAGSAGWRRPKHSATGEDEDGERAGQGSRPEKGETPPAQSSLSHTSWSFWFE